MNNSPSYLTIFLMHLIGLSVFAKRVNQDSEEFLQKLISSSPYPEKTKDMKMALKSLCSGDKTNIPEDSEVKAAFFACKNAMQLSSVRLNLNEEKACYLQSILESVCLDNAPIEKPEANYALPLQALSPEGIFPKKITELPDAFSEYTNLWNEFNNLNIDKGLGKELCANRFFWFEALDKLFLKFFHCQPAFGQTGEDKLFYSLYDQLKTLAAIAASMDFSSNEISEKQNQFLLIKADFWGVQEFIFSGGSHTNKSAAKILRGRSLAVNLITQCGALKILKDLELPPNALLTNAAGQCLILTANTENARDTLTQIQHRFYDWSLRNTLGKSGLQIAWSEIQTHELTDFSLGLQKINRALEVKKFKKFMHKSTPMDFDRDYFEKYFQAHAKNMEASGDVDNEGLCPINSDLGGQIGKNKGLFQLKTQDSEEEGSELMNLSYLSFDQLLAGHAITNKKNRYILFQHNPREKESLEKINSDVYRKENKLIHNYFDFNIRFIESEKIASEAQKPDSFLIFDQMPESEIETGDLFIPPIFINNQLPKYSEEEIRLQKYEAENQKLQIPEAENTKSFPHLAQDNLTSDTDENGKSILRGIRCLVAVKGDIDNLGKVFQQNTKKASPAKFVCLSRTMDLFFSYYLPHLRKSADERQFFENTYTVFAGGDDFFLIGPQKDQIRLSLRMNEEFKNYVAHNAALTFSAGLFMTNSHPNMYNLARSAEQSLDEAKKNVAKKNSVNIYGISMSWKELRTMNEEKEKLDQWIEKYGLSQGFLYKILNFTEMAKDMEADIRNALWYSQLAYTIARLNIFTEEKDMENLKKIKKEIHEFFLQNIHTHKIKFKIPLFNHMYEKRKTN